eukprot:scaffold22940_cov160-Isochrysis_galbana.AAC.1
MDDGGRMQRVAAPQTPLRVLVRHGSHAHSHPLKHHRPCLHCTLTRPAITQYGPLNAQLVPRAMLICTPNGMIPVPEPLETQL